MCFSNMDGENERASKSPSDSKQTLIQHREKIESRIHEQFLCENFYVTNIFERLDSTANICRQFKV